MTAKEVVTELVNEELVVVEEQFLRVRLKAKAAMAALVEWETRTGLSRNNPADLRAFHELTLFAYDGVVQELNDTKDRRDALVDALAFLERT